MKKENLKTTKDEFSLYRIEDNCQIILLPHGDAMEDLFDEFDDHLGNCADILFDENWENATNDNVPGRFSRTHAAIRSKKCSSRQEAKRIISKTQDVKDDFWNIVKQKELPISKVSANAINHLANY